MMVNERQRGALMMMKEDKRYSESWLLRQGKLTQTELNDLVDEGYLIRIDKKTNNVMSDNQYMLTKAGKEIAWKKG